MNDWWKDHLAEYEQDGQRDADRGIYDPPHADNYDPQDQDENAAYQRGFNQRRHELGTKFEWR